MRLWRVVRFWFHRTGCYHCQVYFEEGLLDSQGNETPEADLRPR